MKIYDLYSGQVHKGGSLGYIIRKIYGQGAFVQREEGVFGSERYDAWVVRRCDDKYAHYEEPIAPIRFV